MYVQTTTNYDMIKIRKIPPHPGCYQDCPGGLPRGGGSGGAGAPQEILLSCGAGWDFTYSDHTSSSTTYYCYYYYYYIRTYYILRTYYYYYY